MKDKKEAQIFDKLAKPAQRALLNAGITKLEQLSQLSEKEFSQLHGIGNNALKTIKEAMTQQQLSFAIK